MKKSLLLLLSFALTACSSAGVPFLRQTPTPTPTATAMPTNTPTLAPTLTATPPPNGPCDNPLVPLATGNQWTYRVTTGSGESLYQLAAVERQDAANIVVLVEYTDQKNNILVHEPVICQDGAIEGYPLFVLNMFFSGYLDKYFSTIRESGVYAPDHQSLAQNNWKLEWQAVYLTEDPIYLKNPLGGEDLFILESTEVGLSFQMDGSRESITMPIDNFPQALRISQSFSLPMTVPMAGSGGTSGKLTLQTTQWYEPYVGLLRARIDSASLDMGGMEYGVPIESTIELAEFTPGN
jgi:hypothetical protein